MRLGILAISLLLAACGNEPDATDQQKAAKPSAESRDEANTEVKQAKKTIEEAAEAATKLVEEEARQEIQEISPSIEQTQSE